MPKVSDLFNLDYGHSLELNRLEQSESQNDQFRRTGLHRNNSVTARVEIHSWTNARGSRRVKSVALGGQGGAGVAFATSALLLLTRDVMGIDGAKNRCLSKKSSGGLLVLQPSFRFGFGASSPNHYIERH